jgi:hypothetical protein
MGCFRRASGSVIQRWQWNVSWTSCCVWCEKIPACVRFTGVSSSIFWFSPIISIMKILSWTLMTCSDEMPICTSSGFIRGPGEGVKPLAFAFHNKFKQGPLLSVVRWWSLKFCKKDFFIVWLTYCFHFDNAVLEQWLVLHIPPDTSLTLILLVLDTCVTFCPPRLECNFLFPCNVYTFF